MHLPPRGGGSEADRWRGSQWRERRSHQPRDRGVPPSITTTTSAPREKPILGPRPRENLGAQRGREEGGLPQSWVGAGDL